jgi:hypothetical protein
MIQRERFDAGFFIGDMEGVEEQFALFRLYWLTVAAFPVASAGAAARRLLDLG